jgi:hypothetical protein
LACDVVGSAGTFGDVWSPRSLHTAEAADPKRVTPHAAKLEPACRVNGSTTLYSTSDVVSLVGDVVRSPPPTTAEPTGQEPTIAERVDYTRAHLPAGQRDAYEQALRAAGRQVADAGDVTALSEVVEHWEGQAVAQKR